MVTMTDIMSKARDVVASVKSAEGVTPEKVSVHLEFDSTVLDYRQSDTFLSSFVDFYADSPKDGVDIYLYIQPYSDCKPVRGHASKEASQ